MYLVKANETSNLAQRVVALSVATTFEEARHEWRIAAVRDLREDSDGKTHSARCVCGHEPIAVCYTLVNELNGNVLDPIGNVCIERFERPGMLHEAKDLRAALNVKTVSAELGAEWELPIKRCERPACTPFTRRALRELLALGAFAPGDGEAPDAPDAEEAYLLVKKYLDSHRNDHGVAEEAHRIVEARVRPFLAQWNGEAA